MAFNSCLDLHHHLMLMFSVSKATYILFMYNCWRVLVFYCYECDMITGWYVASAVLPLENKLCTVACCSLGKTVIYKSFYLCVKWLVHFNLSTLCCRWHITEILKLQCSSVGPARVHWKLYKFVFYLMLDLYWAKLLFCLLCHICFFNNHTGDTGRSW